MNVLNPIDVEKREGNLAALQFGMELGDDSTRILRRAIVISLVIHGALILAFLYMKIPVLLQRVHQTHIVDYKEIKTIFQDVHKDVPIMQEVKATQSGTKEKKPTAKKKIRRQSSGAGLLKLALSNTPLKLIELPSPAIPGAVVTKTKTIAVEDATSYTDGPVRLLSLEHIAPKTYKGGMSESLRVSNKTQVSIEPREVEVRGGLEDAVVRRIIEERLPAIRICYETALLQTPELQGEIVVSWTVQPQGQVSDVMSDSKEVGNEDLARCLRERVGLWKFPEPKGGGIVNIRYPFVFRRVNG